jgi:hypothetical protein
MPIGGQLSSGSGIRLQPDFPGIRDTGNGNITGVFTSSYGNFPGSGEIRNITGDTGNLVNVQIGDKSLITLWHGTGGGNAVLGGVVIGSGAEISQSALPSLVTGPIAIGAVSYCSEPGGIALGWSASCGGPILQGSGGINGGIVIGNNSIWNPWASQTSGASIILGAGCQSVHEQGSAFNARGSVIIGNGIWEKINTGGSLGQNILIGGCDTGARLNNSKNNIIIDNFSDTWPAVKTYPVMNDTIILGNSTHTTVKIGAISLPPNTGAYQSVNDAAYVMAVNDKTVSYASITAARIVTLWAAGGVPAGTEILILDASGNCSGVRTITLTPTGADTINGLGTYFMATPYAAVRLISDGVSKWTITASH